jgi:hypothetical protein
MAILTSGTTFVANAQISATDLNNAVNSAVFTSGATDGATTQLSSGAIIVRDGGITPAKITTTSSTWSFVGSIVSSFIGNIAGSIGTFDLVVQTPVTGYAASGSISIGISTGSNQYIEINGTTVFSIAGMYSGTITDLTIKNTSSGSVSVTWPAFNQSGGSFPATLTAGQSMVVTMRAFGTTTASVYAVSSI